MQITMIPAGDFGGFGDSAKMLKALSNAIRDECAEGVRFMSQYPPDSPGSRYIRTGKLRQSWTSEVRTGLSKLEGEVGSSSNVAPYNEEVQGEDQKEVFKNIGWRNVEDLKSKVDKSFPQRAQDEVNQVFK